MSSKIECQVCFDDVKEENAIICCYSTCGKEICKKCVQHWMNEKKVITCPLCNNIFSRAFVVNNFGKTFMNKFGKIEKETLMIREKNMIVEISPFLKMEKDIQQMEIDIEKLKEKKMIYGKMTKQQLYVIEEIQNIFGETGFSKKDVKNYFSREINIMKQNIEQLKMNIKQGKIENVEITDDSKVVIIGCPADGCKGNITKKNYQCCICTLQICNKCFCELEDDHVCKKEDVESVQQINKESKPCPTCGTRISKVDGCNQMFCTNCDCVFDWVTGKIEKGRIHNPHYFEKLRAKNIVIPREVGDNPCDMDREVGYRRMINLMNDIGDMIYGFKRNYRNDLMDNYFNIHNNLFIVVGKMCTNVYNNDYFSRNNANIFAENLPYRLKYAKNEMDEAKFIDKIYKSHVKQCFNNDIHEEMQQNNVVLTMLLEKANELVLQLANKWNNDILIDNIGIKEFNKSIHEAIELYISTLPELINIFTTFDDVLRLLKPRLNSIIELYNKSDVEHFTVHLKDIKNELIDDDINEKIDEILSSLEQLKLFK